MRKLLWLYHCLLVLAIVSLGVFGRRLPTKGPAPEHAVQDDYAASAPLLACPGRIEGRSEPVEVGAAVDGIIRAVYVREGDLVRKGDRIAAMECEEAAAEVAATTADIQTLRRQRQLLLAGSRREERAIAAERRSAAHARLAQASSRLEQFRRLYQSGDVSRASFEETQRDWGVAQAQLNEAIQSEELVNAAPRPEEVARMDAEISAAGQRAAQARAKLNRCSVIAPSAGRVLGIHLKPGEVFAAIAGRRIMTIADVSCRRVRAEVDEQDIGRLRCGQTVLALSEASPGWRFRGTVRSVARMMGRKSIRTGEPNEKSDRDILEAVADLEPAAEVLPIGFRVTVQFLR
jgi:HlyD family secretion protein